MSSAWGGWSTKLNVTSIVSQGLEQVRTLREDVEKSFDQVVTGAPGALVPLPLTGSRQEQMSNELDDVKVEKAQIEARTNDTEASKMQLEDRSVDIEANKLQSEDKTTVADVMQSEAQQVVVKKVTESTKILEDEIKSTVIAVGETGGVGKSKSEATTESGQMEQEGQTQELEVDVLDEQRETQDEKEQKISDQSSKEFEMEAEVGKEMVADRVEDEEKSVEAADDQKEEKLEFTGDNDVLTLRSELKLRESQLLSTSATIQELHNELDKTCHREVAAVERAQFLTEQLENMRREVTKLTQLHRDTSTSQNADVQALQMALAEKEEKLNALLDEGQALSVKQAQLEQRLRTIRKEKDEAEKRASKLLLQLEVSTEKLNELSTTLKSCEEEKTRLACENDRFASSATTLKARVEKAEQEAEEFMRQSKDLQTQVEQLTQNMASKTNEAEKLKSLIQTNEALILEKEELRHTVMFLQESNRDVEQDAARREEMARAEIADLKRKWQDAVARVDRLGQSVSEATQPLLRQIHVLQEELRTRQENWKFTEAILLTRIEDAGERGRVIEQEKLNMEQLVHKLKQKVEESELECTRRQTELNCALEAVESARVEARDFLGQIDALQFDLSQAKHEHDAEVAANKQLQARLDEAEKALLKLETSATATVELEQARERETQLRQDLEWHKQELQRMENRLTTAAPLSTEYTSSYYGKGSVDSEDCEGALSSEASILKTTLETTINDSVHPDNGNTSVLGLSQLQQRLRLRDGENQMLKQQLEALKARQKRTTDEIVRLSTRNALLESGEAQREQAQLELAKMRKHQVVLLELFGEKEEQVEELQAEVSELKAFYRKQLDTLATHNEQQQK